jgi:hypothetical protein
MRALIVLRQVRSDRVVHNRCGHNHCGPIACTDNLCISEKSSAQTLYLTSPGGILRRMVVIERGIGRTATPSTADVEVFEKEKKMWKEQLAAQTIK